jgi:hypothetical protein
MGMTNLKGNIAELSVAAECAKRNWVVCFPFGEDSPYDILVDTGSQFLRVQVKYLTSKNDGLNVPMYSTTGVKYKDTVDVIAVYCPCNEKVYWIDLSTGQFDNNITGVRLKLTKPKNNQVKGIWLAENFEMI